MSKVQDLSTTLAKTYRLLAQRLELTAKQIEDQIDLSEGQVSDFLNGVNLILEKVPYFTIIPSGEEDKILEDKMIGEPLSESSKLKIKLKKKIGKRLIDFNIFQVFTKGGKRTLIQELNSFGIDNLKKIVSQHRLDSGGLTRKWKDKQRLIKLIVDRVESRSKKGDVFRKY